MTKKKVAIVGDNTGREFAKAMAKVVENQTKDTEIKKKVEGCISEIVLQVASKQVEWCTNAINTRQEPLSRVDFQEFVDAILSIDHLGIFSDEEVPELADDEINFHKHLYVDHKHEHFIYNFKGVAQAQRDLTKGYRRVIERRKSKVY